MEAGTITRVPFWITALKNWPMILVWTFLGITFIIVVTVVYNVYFHPLSKYPGPKKAAATDLIFHYTRIRGNQLSWTCELHERYGEVVRVGPNRLSYINPQAWKDIYGHRIGGKVENSKDIHSFPPEINGERSLVSIIDAHEHGRLRRVFSNAFSDKALKLQEPLIKAYVDQLIGNMKRSVASQPDFPLQMEKMYNCTTFDIMGDLTFGEPLGLLQQSEYTPWLKAAFGRIRMITVMTLLLEYPMVARIAKWFIPRRFKQQQRMHFEHSSQRVDRRLAKDTGENKPDIWSLVLEKGMDQLTLPKMHANASLFMLAGTETTATLLSGLTFYLLKNPTTMQRLVEEVRALREDELLLEMLPRLPYLNACFEEGLRVYPPIPNGLPRQVARGGNVIFGKLVPEKTSVMVSQGAAYRSSLNFKDPDSFIPERWLPGTGYESDKRDVLQPFSIGPRNCLGKNLAYHEMRIILASVLWHFDLELCPLSSHWANQKTYIIWEKHPLLVKARLRQHVD